jgi:L-proline 4-hydroxylase
METTPQITPRIRPQPRSRRALLTPARRAAFERDGCIFCPRVFSAVEVAALEAGLAGITDPSRPGVRVEAASGTVRMSHGAHAYSETFRRLTRHPRLVAAARELLGGDVYLYQTRLNLKAGLSRVPAGGYPWHQDFSTWHLRDGMPEPRAVVVFVFLDDVTACNAPLLVVPGSHRAGLLDDGDRAAGDGGAYRQVLISPERLRALVERQGMAAQTGPRGSVLLMHCNLVHGSTENISPLRRALYSVVYNAVDNRVTAEDCRPVTPLADDCLLQPVA